MADDFAGGGDMDWSKFSNGETAKRRQLVYNPDAAHRGDFGDEWAGRAFNIPSFPGPAGAPPDSVYKNWK